MKVTALVMAGGKGTRMTLAEEKPLLHIGGKPVIDHVLKALKHAEKIPCLAPLLWISTPALK